MTVKKIWAAAKPGSGPTLEIWSGLNKLAHQEKLGPIRYDIQTPVLLQDLELEVLGLRQNIRQIKIELWIVRAIALGIVFYYFS